MPDEEIIAFLRASRKKWGELYPVLVTEDGRYIDGEHRRRGQWESQHVIEGRISDIDFLALRWMANHRRRVPHAEKARIINDLAQALIAEGIAQIPDHSPSVARHLQNRPLVQPYIAELLGISSSAVGKYLRSEFKRGAGPEIPIAEREALIAAETLPAGARKAVFRKEGSRRPRHKRPASTRRSMFQIRADVLRQLVIKGRGRNEGLGVTRLMYATNTSYVEIQKQLTFLESRHLILTENRAKFITELGMQVLHAYIFAEHYLLERDEVFHSLPEFLKGRELAVITDTIEPTVVDVPDGEADEGTEGINAEDDLQV